MTSFWPWEQLFSSDTRVNAVSQCWPVTYRSGKLLTYWSGVARRLFTKFLSREISFGSSWPSSYTSLLKNILDTTEHFCLQEAWSWVCGPPLLNGPFVHCAHPWHHLILLILISPLFSCSHLVAFNFILSHGDCIYMGCSNTFSETFPPGTNLSTLPFFREERVFR